MLLSKFLFFLQNIPDYFYYIIKHKHNIYYGQNAVYLCYLAAQICAIGSQSAFGVFSNNLSVLFEKCSVANPNPQRVQGDIILMHIAVLAQTTNTVVNKPPYNANLNCF